MGRASRARRDGAGLPRKRTGRSQEPREHPPGYGLSRLARTNAPGRLSLAGAYAFGYGALGMAQLDDDEPDWYNDVDPLDALFLGTAFPQRFRDAAEFGNARTAWLRLMRTTPYWAGIQKLVAEAVSISEELSLPIDEGQTMLCLADRLEDLGLDQRKLPAALLPANALANGRFLGIRPDEIHFTEPTPDAKEQARRLFASLDADIEHDDTCGDALREGLSMLARAGLPVEQEAAILLVALYTALVANDGEHLSDAGEHAEAWALGLAEDSPLVPVVDTMMVAANKAIEPEEAVAHLYMLPTFSEKVSSQDRRWHSAPGTDFVPLAFELGIKHITAREGKTVRMPAAITPMVGGLTRRFEEHFGRPPGPEDPLFFDPDQDEPTPMSLLDIERHQIDMLEAAGFHPAWLYACQQTQGLMPMPDGDYATAQDEAEWHEAVERYLRLHPDSDFDEDIEFQRLRNMAAISVLTSAVHDSDVASSILNQLEVFARGAVTDGSIDAVAEFAEGNLPQFAEAIRNEPGGLDRTVELARAWSGLDMAERVRQAATAPAAPPARIDVAAAFVIIAATLSALTRPAD